MNSNISKEQGLISFRRLSLGEVSGQFLNGCAKLYCKIWKEPPWNEIFWLPEQVKQDLLAQLAKPSAIGLVALCSADKSLSRLGVEEVVGFTWGYAVTREELKDISGVAELGCLFHSENQFFYIDELAVSYDYRRKGIGKKLSSSLLESAFDNFSHVVLRTDEKALVARLLYSQLGFRELSARDKNYPTRTYWFL